MSETDMTDYAELRAALAAGPAIGPYTVDQDNSDGIVVVDGRGNIVAEANYGDVPTEYGPDITETLIRGVRSTYRYIAAANPVTTTALLAERDALREALKKLNREQIGLEDRAMTDNIKDGGPAFPGQWYDFQPYTGDQVVREQWEGMTLRDYFAAKAMQSLISKHGFIRNAINFAAEHSYEIADAMLRAREVRND